jgi:hypothetical protein
LTTDEAAARLGAKFDTYAGTPLAIRAGDVALRLTPVNLGFRSDAARQVAQES